MKQLIQKFIPDENAAWKMATVVLLFLLVVTLLVNSVVPLVQNFATALLGGNGHDDELMTMLVQKEETPAPTTAAEDPDVRVLRRQIEQDEKLITELEGKVAECEQEAQQLRESLEKNTAESQAELDQLRQEIARMEAEANELRALLEDALVAKEAREMELEDIRKKFAKEHILVIKLSRTGLLGNIETIYINWPVGAEEYARRQVGEPVQPVQGLDFPTGENWDAVITNKYINTIEI